MRLRFPWRTGFAQGGAIAPYRPSPDSVVAMLSPGFTVFYEPSGRGAAYDMNAALGLADEPPPANSVTVHRCELPPSTTGEGQDSR